MAVHVLKNGSISVDILTDWGYDRSRYDWGGTVEQVTMDGHTFLSKELQPSGGTGLAGVGLTNVFEWADTSLYEQTAVADYFPMLGLGLLKKPDTAPFQFTRDYSVLPFARIVTSDDRSVSVRTLPHLCLDMAADMTKSYTLDGNSLIVSFDIRNVGIRQINATEFCHNFIKFDTSEIDENYRVSFPYSIQAKIRRGEIIMERDAYRIGRFDKPTASSAFWINGWEGLRSHWMKIEHLKLGSSVLIEDDFPVCNFYSWNNFNACCPEVFAPIKLSPGESVHYTRRYTFQTKAAADILY